MNNLTTFDYMYSHGWFYLQSSTDPADVAATDAGEANQGMEIFHLKAPDGYDGLAQMVLNLTKQYEAS